MQGTESSYVRTQAPTIPVKKPAKHTGHETELEGDSCSCTAFVMVHPAGPGSKKGLMVLLLGKICIL